MSQLLTATDYQTAAKKINCSEAAIRAVAEIESSGNGFLPSGRPVVNFEPHVMYQRLRLHYGQERADAELAAHPDLVMRSGGSNLTRQGEWDQMQKAAKLIDTQCAFESASWGMFQIMGYHWEDLGFDTLLQFVSEMDTAEGQLDAFTGFILNNKRLVRAIQIGDWASFAYRYNGPGYAANDYHTKMAAAFLRWTKALV